MGPNLESCALTGGNLCVCGGSNFSSFDKTSSRSSNGTIIGRNGVVCCLRMTALRPVIVVRSSVQKPATIPCDHGSFKVSAPPLLCGRRVAGTASTADAPKRLGYAQPFLVCSSTRCQNNTNS